MHKERAAQTWCENVTALTATTWRYLKVMQKSFEELRSELLVDLKVLG